MHYQFNKIYFRVTGEYENDIQLLFFDADAADMIVFDCGMFYLVNKPGELCLDGFSCYHKKIKQNYQFKRIAEGKDEIYVELNNAVLKFAWCFSTADGQQVKDFCLYTEEEHPSHNAEVIKSIASAFEVTVTDFRFILPSK